MENKSSRMVLPTSSANCGRRSCQGTRCPFSQELRLTRALFAIRHFSPDSKIILRHISLISSTTIITTYEIRILPCRDLVKFTEVTSKSLLPTAPQRPLAGGSVSLEKRIGMEHSKQAHTETHTVHPAQTQTSTFWLVHCYPHPTPPFPWLCQHSNQEAQTQTATSLALRHQPVGVSTLPVPSESPSKGALFPTSVI